MSLGLTGNREVSNLLELIWSGVGGDLCNGKPQLSLVSDIKECLRCKIESLSLPPLVARPTYGGLPLDYQLVSASSQIFRDPVKHVINMTAEHCTC